MLAGIESSALMNPHPTGIALYVNKIVQEFDQMALPDFDYHLLLSWFRRKDKQYVPAQWAARYRWHTKSVFPFRHKYDLVHFTDSAFVDIAHCKKIATIHDLAIFMPEHAAIQDYTSGYFIRKTRQKLERTLKIADALIAVSENTKADLVRLFNYPAHRIQVIYPGADLRIWPKAPSDVLSRYRLEDKKFFLFTGSVSVRKNLLNLVSAFRQSGLYKEYKLVMAGNPSMGYDRIRKLTTELQLDDAILFTDYLSDADIRSLYLHAGAFTFPTYYEGFGVPIIEAMHHRLPVLTANRGSAPEITQGYATLADPFDTDSIADGLRQVVKTSPGTVEAAFRHAQSFTWRRCAAETYNAYRQLTGL